MASVCFDQPSPINVSTSLSLDHLGGILNGTVSVAEFITGFQLVAFQAIKRQYLNNDYFVGGLGIMVLGFLGRFFSVHSRKMFEFMTRTRGVYKLSVKPGDPSYNWLQEWLCKHASKNTWHLTLQSKWDSTDEGFAGPKRPQLYFIPQLLEAQTILYHNQMVRFQILKKVGPANMGEEDGSDLASLLKSASGCEQLVMEGPTREVLEAIVKESMEDHYEKEEGSKMTSVMRWGCKEMYWTTVTNRLVRPLSTVILACDVDEMLKDARQFLASRKWYSDRGIPHRRGYIFHGPPGCGKTSLIQAMAGELGHDVAMIGLSNKEMDDDMLQTAMSVAPTNSVLVLEDVDAVFVQRNEVEGSGSSLSFSGLLNAIDGMTAQEGHILVMTTNYIDRLDSALIRPGRVDLRLHLGLATRQQISRMVLQFYKDASMEDADRFSALLPEATLSPAQIQGYFLVHRDDIESAMANVGNLLEQHKEEQLRVEGSKGGKSKGTEQSKSYEIVDSSED